MQSIVKILRDSRTSASAFVADTRALAATEFAMMVPLMLIMFFGTVELSSAVAIDRKVTLIARTLSDLTSQSAGTVTDTNLLNSFNAGTRIVRPYDPNPLTGTIVQIYIDANSKATIQWSKSAVVTSGSVSLMDTDPSSSLAANTTVTTMIPPTLLIPSTYLIFSKVSYVYAATVKYVLKSGVTLSDVSYTRPRQVTCIAYGGVPTSC